MRARARPAPTASAPGLATAIACVGAAFAHACCALCARCVHAVRARAARGHSLKFALASDTDITLRKYGEFLFDNLILLVPTAEEFGSLEISSLTEFVDEGGSILLATSEDVSETVRDFAAECGVDFDADGSRVIDHFNFHAPDKTHTTVYSAAFIGVRALAVVLLAARCASTPVRARQCRRRMWWALWMQHRRRWCSVALGTRWIRATSWRCRSLRRRPRRTARCRTSHCRMSPRCAAAAAARTRAETSTPA